MRDVHVIIPLYRRFEYFVKCLDSVVKNRTDNTHIFIQYDGPLLKKVIQKCKGIFNLTLKGKAVHEGISPTLSACMEMSLDTDPEAIRFLLASDHLAPYGFAQAAMEAVNCVGSEFEFGKWQTHPGADGYFNRIWNSNLKKHSLPSGYHVIIVNDLQYVCSLPSVVVGEEATRSLVDFMRQEEVSEIPGISVGRLFLTFWGLRLKQTGPNVFAVVGGPVEHMGNPASAHLIRTREYVQYEKDLKRARQKIRPVGFYDKMYRRGSGGYGGYGTGSTYTLLWNRVANILSSDSGPKRVLDAGCGSGGMAVALKKKCHSVEEYRGVDFCQVAITKATKFVSEVFGSGNYDFTVGDVRWKGFYDWNYSHFLCILTLSHLEDDLALIKLVRPGTVVVLALASRVGAGQVRAYLSGDEIVSRFGKFLDFEFVEKFRRQASTVEWICKAVRRND